MTAAAAANEIKSNIGPDFTLADAHDLDYLDTDAQPEEDEREARQALNLRMAEWYDIG